MKMAYEKRKSMYGYCFIALWFVGALIFFLRGDIDMHSLGDMP